MISADNTNTIDKNLCTMRQDLELFPTKDKTEHLWIVKDSISGNLYRLDLKSFEILRHWKDGATPSEVTEAVNKNTPLTITDFDVIAVNKFLRQNFLCFPEMNDLSRFKSVKSGLRANPANLLQKLLYYRGGSSFLYLFYVRPSRIT